ncbi:transposase [Streptomyces acidiscabies]|uniref:transposase n=1 Tax=Streptomyces acidiscabies TaxID=42234 RepID=UPI0038F5E32A
MAYVKALIASVERRNGWQIAGHAGHGSPDRVQWFLARSTWCADQLRDALRSFVVQFPACEDGVLDGTAFSKKGRMPAGDGGVRRAGCPAPGCRHRAGRRRCPPTTGCSYRRRGRGDTAGRGRWPGGSGRPG